jgi:SsrA-binding protein
MLRKINIENRKAKHDYEIIDTYDSGIVLTGSEVKSLRDGSGSIVESFCQFKGNELFLVNSYIPTKSTFSRFTAHQERGERKLLLNRSELTKLQKGVSQKGMTIVPLRMFSNDKGLVKVKIGLCRGKHNYDKREDIKRRDIERDMNR